MFFPTSISSPRLSSLGVLHIEGSQTIVRRWLVDIDKRIYFLVQGFLEDFAFERKELGENKLTATEPFALSNVCGCGRHKVMILMPIPSLSPSAHLSTASKSVNFCPPFDVITQLPRPPRKARLSTIRMCNVSIPPTGIRGRKPRKKRESSSSDEHELVCVLMRNFSDKQPLTSTLNKYVQLVRTEHCFLLFEELGKNDNWLQCLEVFRWMQKQRWYIADNGVYSKLISVMGRKGQTRMVMWLFSEMRNSGCKPDSSVYNALITAHLHSRDKQKALAKALMYFDKMKGMERCKPNIVTYNILLRAFAQAKNTDQVNGLFKDLSESIVAPDIYTFNGVMDAYGKNGMIREMELVLSKMKSNQIKPDVITFNLLIDSYGRKQEFDKMEQVYKSLLHSKEKPTLPTFHSMITNYSKARLREKAELVFKRMTDMGYKPSFITSECLIMMYGYCDCVSKAREIFDQVAESHKEKKVSTLNAMLEAYCMNSLPMEATTLFEGVCASRKFPVDSSTYKLLYKAYTKADMKDLLQKLLVSMDKDGIIPNKKFFLDALGDIGSSVTNKSSKGKPDRRTPVAK